MCLLMLYFLFNFAIIIDPYDCVLLISLTSSSQYWGRGRSSQISIFMERQNYRLSNLF